MFTNKWDVKIALELAPIVKLNFNVNRDFEISWGYEQYSALSDSHVTSSHWRPSNAT